MYSFGSIWLDAPNKLIPARSGDSNIAMSGCFDLPARLGETSHDWADQNGVEPYVDQDELFFSGRDITLKMLMKGSKSYVCQQIQFIYDQINAFTTTQTLSTPYGVFYDVYLKKAPVIQYNSISEITFEFREPNPGLSYGMLPYTGSADNMIDGIPFLSFGLYISSQTDKASLPELKEQKYTSYLIEKFKAVKRKEKILQINGFIIGNDINDFLDKVFALQLIFTSPGLRKIKLNGNIEIECFAKDGFKVTNVNLSSKMIANFAIDLTITNEKELQILTTNNGKGILTHNGNLILI